MSVNDESTPHERLPFFTRNEKLEQELAEKIRTLADDAVAAQRRQHFQTIVAQCLPAAQHEVKGLYVIGGSEERLRSIVTLAADMARDILKLEP